MLLKRLDEAGRINWATRVNVMYVWFLLCVGRPRS